jgi:hypothetical protein
MAETLREMRWISIRPVAMSTRLFTHAEAKNGEGGMGARPSE